MFLTDEEVRMLESVGFRIDHKTSNNSIVEVYSGNTRRATIGNDGSMAFYQPINGNRVVILVRLLKDLCDKMPILGRNYL